MNAEWKRLRVALVKRSEGACECCGEWAGDAGQVDHFWGRGAGRPEQSEKTTWFLLSSHHIEKTNNYPSARFWLEKFRAHSTRLGNHEEADRADARIGWLIARRQAERSYLTEDQQNELTREKP